MRRIAWLALLFASSALGADRWTMEVGGGGAHNFKSRLEIHQDGGFSQVVSADWDTRPLRSPPYYMLRVARWDREGAWEGSLIHHKLYLANPPAGVSSVSISHGFNLLTLNRAWRHGDWIVRVGAGPVLTHAEATIRGTTYEGPYRFSGAAALAGAGRTFRISPSFFLGVEGALSAAKAKPKLWGPPDGRLEATNVAAHFIVTVGYDLP